MTPLKNNVFENIKENGAFAFGANDLFSIILSKVFKTLLNFFLEFFQCHLNVAMIPVMANKMQLFHI